MSTRDISSREPAFGCEGPPEAEATKEDAGRRGDAMLLLGLGISGIAAYAAMGYGIYALASSFL